MAWYFSKIIYKCFERCILEHLQSGRNIGIEYIDFFASFKVIVILF